MSTIDIGLHDDQILQRFLVRRIYREAEFLIKEADGEVHVGFITGFDERCLQISTTPLDDIDNTPRAVLIFWPIAKIEETGRRLEDLDPDHRSEIRRYGHVLRSLCKVALNTDREDRVRQARDPGIDEL